ncbi:DUF4935 domain-containing protein [Vibrio alginolyticus]|uniref:PIN domain-containing protein n=1 Tax=Vibrio alginolyticus TaxID=663 RepID=UPI001BD4E4CC|nr:PIN domain-containing protein [Vibrio alginolyticus]EJX2556630.1 DUF4935 domain-containing protein [Vibrio alginolyticus]ELB2861788.1 DUF4935 domain-containing protein [Vibrio alginolyticus]MBT0003143.1 DUF4935 domain-containing protein [Vibrio alginolyticus]
MPSYIVFDTNYLRGIKTDDYFNNRIPEKLFDQIEKAISRGDMVALPRTVQIEFNAHLKKIAEKRHQALEQAYELLVSNGFEISTEPPNKVNYVDVWDVIKSKFDQVHLLEPTESDYLEAETRASFRNPPYPKNKPESEEMRDRVIWCQLLSLSKSIEVPVYIVSDDKIFENGTKSEEGRDANIFVLQGEDELNQHLESTPPHIKTLIDNILLFSPQLAEHGVPITREDIDMVSDIRMINIDLNQKENKFTLSLKHDKEVSWDGRLIYRSDKPKTLTLVNDLKSVVVEYDSETPELNSIEQLERVSAKERSLMELRRAIGG